MSRTLFVPGNLLLFGEYAVVEPGGLGLACAIGPHVRAYIESDEGFRIEGRLGAHRVNWSASSKRNSPEDFLCRVADFAQGWCRERGIDIATLRSRVIVDSSAFISESGQKRGFGSSAAATVALCAVICELSGVHDDAQRFDLALRAHRHAQGGKGSGYDVAVSYFGGLGLFRGGDRPELESIHLEWLPPLSLYESGSPSSSSGAVSRYAAWKAEYRKEARAFLERSNDLISGLVAQRSWSAAYPIAAELAELGKSLGDSIGVPADIARSSLANDSEAGVRGGVRGAAGHGGGEDGRGRDGRGSGGHNSGAAGDRVRAAAGESTIHEGNGGAGTTYAGRAELCKAVGAGAELAVCFNPTGGHASNGLLPVDIDWEGCTWR